LRDAEQLLMQGDLESVAARLREVSATLPDLLRGDVEAFLQACER